MTTNYRIIRVTRRAPWNVQRNRRGGACVTWLVVDTNGRVHAELFRRKDAAAHITALTTAGK